MNVWWTRYGRPHAPQYSVGPGSQVDTLGGFPKTEECLRHSPRPSRRGRRGLWRGAWSQRRESIRSAASPRARPDGLHAGQPSAPRDGGDVEPASIMDNLTRLLASPEHDPKGNVRRICPDVTVDDLFALSGERETWNSPPSSALRSPLLASQHVDQVPAHRLRGQPLRRPQRPC